MESKQEVTGPGAIGPGAIELQGEAPKPMLEGVTAYQYVEIFNPLSQDFRAQVGATKPANTPIKIYRDPVTQAATKTESDLQTNYGLGGFKNSEHRDNIHIGQPIEIKSGQTKRIPGNAAQVVVRQLTNEIMGREGNKELMADPFARNKVEQRIVRKIGNVDEFMEQPIQSVDQQLNQALENKNAEQEFPEAVREDSASERPAGQPERRSPGRPRKDQS